jgi:hypothetical protein
VTQDLDYSWSKEPTDSCDTLPTYEFKLVKYGETSSFELVKAAAKP